MPSVAAPAARSSSAARTARSASSSCSDAKPEHPDGGVAVELLDRPAVPLEHVGAHGRAAGEHGVQLTPDRAARRAPTCPRRSRRRRSRAGARRPAAAARRVRAGPAASRRGSASAGSCARIARVQLAQPLPGLDAELLDELAPRVLVGLQRVRLPVAAIEREHQLGAQTAPGSGYSRISAGSRRRRRRGVRAPARSRSAARAPRPRNSSRRLISACANGSYAEVAERCAAPQRERALERARRRLRDGRRPARGRPRR